MVLTQDGEPAASLELPSAYTPYRIVGNTVIGVSRDSADVEYVVAYEVATY